MKLRESRFFLKHLRESRDASQETFQFYLSAFINAGRSVLQYAMDENQQGPPHQKRWIDPACRTWYDKWAQDPVIRFFKDNRDDNIHVQPIEAEHSSGVMMGSPGHIKFKPQQPGDSHLEVERYEMPGEMGGLWKLWIAFTDWQGPEQVEELCEQYVNLLDAFINDGIGRGYLKNP